MTEEKTKSTVQIFSSPKTHLPLISESSAVIRNYLSETRWLVKALKEKPNFAREILRVLSVTKDNSRILGFTPVYKMLIAVENLYKAILDEKIVLNENLMVLLEKVSAKIAEMCILIEKGEFEELFEAEIRQYLLYLDKAEVGEIFNSEYLGEEKANLSFIQQTAS